MDRTPVSGIPDANPAGAPSPTGPARPGAERSGPEPLTRKVVVALIAVLAVAAALRLYNLAGDSYWYDEVCTLEASSGRDLAHFTLPTQRVIEAPPNLVGLDGAPPAWRIWTSLSLDVHPPLYFIAVRLWRDLFGSGEFAVRALSVLFGVAAVELMFDVGRLAHNTRAGLWAAAVMAVAGPEVNYAQEARMYAMATALSLGAADALLRVRRSGASAGRLAALGACAAGMMLTHYAAIGIGAALGAYALLAMRGKDRVRAACVLAGAAAVFAVAWGPFFLEQRRNSEFERQDFLMQADWTPGGWLADVASAPVRLLGAPIRREIASTWPAVVIYVLPLLLLLRRQPAVLLWLLWLAGTVGLVAAVAARTHGYHLQFVRYILLAAPAFYLLLAGMLSDRAGRWLPNALPAAAVALGVLSLSVTYRQRQLTELDVVARLLDEATRPGDLLAFCRDAKRNWYSGVYMMHSLYSRRPPGPILILTEPPGPELLAEMRRYPGIGVRFVTDRPIADFFPGYRFEKVWSFYPHGTTGRLVREPAATGPAPATAPAVSTDSTPAASQR